MAIATENFVVPATTKGFEDGLNFISSILHHYSLHLINYQNADFGFSSNGSSASAYAGIFSTDASTPKGPVCFPQVYPTTTTARGWRLQKLLFLNYCMVHIFLSPSIKNVETTYLSKPPLHCNCNDSVFLNILRIFGLVDELTLGEFGESIFGQHRTLRDL